MIQAAREIIGEKGITVSTKQVIAVEVMRMLNVWSVCTGIMARDRTCLGPRDQPRPTGQYRQDYKRLSTSSPLLTFDLITPTPAVHRLRAARPDLSTLPDQEDGRQGPLEGYRRLLARSYRQGHRHGWDLPICELSLQVVVRVIGGHADHKSFLQIVVKSRLASPSFTVMILDLELIASTIVPLAASGHPSIRFLCTGHPTDPA